MSHNSNQPHRTIVITGASRGLGRAMTDAFIAAGHTVCGCGRNAALIHALSHLYPAPHRFDCVDVGNDHAVQQWAAAIRKDVGPPDLLINNAALMNQLAPLWRVPPEEFAAILNVNIAGTFHTLRHFLPAMIERGSGIVVNFSSGWGRVTSPQVAPYCTTKWAIEGLTRALAQELPTGMAAVAYSPGIIDTDMLRTCWNEEAAQHPKPDVWAKESVPFLLHLGPQDNGKSF